ncbi:unnamed protein product [Rotaria magnacalcarata]|uniref:Thiaminase-2/PQQC domain-containing protein n=1 Tax=Rotaria magnacalcarata TaxID=392030 RepID=A0A816C6T0_9BILA|nr:unnamed protein product [Rotaria magnacalcarata]CAF4023490.1 unnamed protein product [Rotaria magnacalcarata]
MSTVSIATDIYPTDQFRVPTVMCIGTQDRTSQMKGVDADTIINQHLGCTTHPIISSVITDQNEITQFSSTLSFQFDSVDQSSINSVKISFLCNVDDVQEVKIFLDSITDKNCHVILDLITDQWNNEVLQAIYGSILSFLSVLTITYDIATGLLASDQQSMEDTAHLLLKLGPQVVVIQDKNQQRWMAFTNNNELLKKHCYLLPGNIDISNDGAFSAAIAASLAHNHHSLLSTILNVHMYWLVEQSLRSSFLHILPLTFTQELWSFVNDIYAETLKLPFLNKMLDSTLNERIYDYYIVQDYLFFLDRGRMLNGLINQCSNEEAHRYFTMQLDKNDKWALTLLSDNNLPPHDEKTTAKMPACEQYTKFLLALTSCNDHLVWIKGLIALLPCTLLYFKVGDWMIASGVQPTVKRYADFVDYYRDQARRDRLIYFLDLTNRVVNDCSHEQKNELKLLFRQVCEYEYAFWDESYRYGMSKAEK